MGAQWGQPWAAVVPEYHPARRWLRVPACSPPLRAHWQSPSVPARRWQEVPVYWLPLPAHWLSPSVLRPWCFRCGGGFGAVAAGGTVVASGDDGAAVASGDETGTLESDEPPQATARRTKDTAIAAKNISLGTGFRPPAAFVIIRYNCYSLRVPDSLHLRPDPQRRKGRGRTSSRNRPGTPSRNSGSSI